MGIGQLWNDPYFARFRAIFTAAVASVVIAHVWPDLVDRHPHLEYGAIMKYVWGAKGETAYHDQVSIWALQLEGLYNMTHHGMVEKLDFHDAIQDTGKWPDATRELARIYEKARHLKHYKEAEQLIHSEVDRIDKEVQTILPHHTHDENTKEHHETADMIENMYARNKVQTVRDHLKTVIHEFASLDEYVDKLQVEITASKEVQEHQKQVEGTIALFWHNNGLDVRDPNENHMAILEDQEKMAMVYGELTTAGLRRVFAALGILGHEPVARSGKHVHFLDFGSGLGKLVIQAYLEFPAVHDSVGFELHKDRFEFADKIWKKMHSESLAVSARGQAMKLAPVDSHHPYREAAVGYQMKDYLHADVSKATHIFISPGVIPGESDKTLAKKLWEDGSELCMIAALRDIVKLEDVGFRYYGHVKAMMSWGHDATIHIYQKGDCHGGVALGHIPRID